MEQEVSFEDFLKVDIRMGTIIAVNDFEKARKPAYQLKIDFGNLGIKKSSAQITNLYTKEDLLHKQVSAIVNFKPRQIANFMSEVLVLGVYNKNGKVVLLQANKAVKNGEQLR
ncbi:tRNA-binding protein [uncultured Polaribacter sp.]|uniref:tRNA-binding protein n=1 Tax=uncultured Polaribacter sp. TaxID=174711 RepID=UPI00261594DB|nr:tRNA-binding protein [uncultured Polaribacter sp.]